MRAVKVDAAQGLAWIACGYRELRRQPALWFGMALLYFVVVAALKQIPFLGTLVLVLISPLLLAGALLAARDAVPGSAPVAAAPAALKGRFLLDSWLLGPGRWLLAARRDPHVLLRALVASVLTLGLTLLVTIVEAPLTGGSVVSGLAAAQLAAPLKPTFVAGMTIVAALYVLLAMALCYLVPLSVLGDLPPMEALHASFTGCRANAGAVGLFLGTFFLAYLAIAVSYALLPWLGLVLTLTLGLALLPLFVAGGYCSYRALFPAA